MSDDLVKRLRVYEWAHPVIKEAADRIEAQDKRIEQLENIIEWSGLPWPEDK